MAGRQRPHERSSCILGERAMKFLFDSRGKHIANFVNGQLHSPSGSNIGHFVEQHGIFIDMLGRYLGEIVRENRLMYNRSSGHDSANYGAYGDFGSVGSFGDPGSVGSIGTIGGYEDIPLDRLGQHV